AGRAGSPPRSRISPRSRAGPEMPSSRPSLLGGMVPQTLDVSLANALLDLLVARQLVRLAAVRLGLCHARIGRIGEGRLLDAHGRSDADVHVVVVRLAVAGLDEDLGGAGEYPGILVHALGEGEEPLAERRRDEDAHDPRLLVEEKGADQGPVALGVEVE